jgi:hypothetical protein
MSKRDQLEGMIVLLRAMGGETNVIEKMEVAGQREAISRTSLPKDMSPSKEDYESLGFAFSDIPGDDVLCNGILPNGWSLRMESSYGTTILDENGLERGYFFYKAVFYDRSANMSLCCRYGIMTDYLDDTHSLREIYFGNKKEKLFVAGQVHINRDAEREAKLKAYETEEQLQEQARQFANENYPDWKNVHAYWDISKKDLSNDNQKKLEK